MKSKETHIDPKGIAFLLKNTTDSRLLDEDVQAYLQSLIRKDIPMEIEEVFEDGYTCPSCDCENSAFDYGVYDSFCPNCGQKLVQIKSKENICADS